MTNRQNIDPDKSINEIVQQIEKAAQPGRVDCWLCHGARTVPAIDLMHGKKPEKHRVPCPECGTDRG